MRKIPLQHIWPPFTSLVPPPEAVEITTGKGAVLTDADGNTLIDAISSWWVNTFGHRHPEIVAAVKNQLDELEHVLLAGFVHPKALEVAKWLVQNGPGNPEKAFFSDNGSTAVEVALKMAIQYQANRGTGKHRIVAFEKAYHGDTFGAMSVGGEEVFFGAFAPYRFSVDRLPLPDENNAEAVLQQFEQWLDTGEVSAFIFEPLIQGSAGMRMYPARYLDALIAIAQSHGVVTIADEVMTGFGRTGLPFACNHLENQPDIVCLSKGITGGFLPLGATLCNARMVEAFLSDDPHKTLYHGHSYTGNPLACAAAVAATDLCMRPEARADWQRIETHHQTLAHELVQHTAVKNIRICGTVMAWELETGEEEGYLNPVRDKLIPFFHENGVLLRPLGNTVYILPPYCITDDQMQHVQQTVLKSLALL